MDSHCGGDLDEAMKMASRYFAPDLSCKLGRAQAAHDSWARRMWMETEKDNTRPAFLAAIAGIE